MSPTLAQIKARLEKATKGPWSWFDISDKGNGYIIGTAFDERGRQLCGRIPDDLFFDEEKLRIGAQIGEHEAATCDYADADFIAHAPDDIAFLLREVERLDGNLDRTAADYRKSQQKLAQAEVRCTALAQRAPHEADCHYWDDKIGCDCDLKAYQPQEGAR
mgnify:CR=1 FL=1